MTADLPKLPEHNPWRDFIENCANGDNFFRRSEYNDLIEELDRLYLIEESCRATAEQAGKVEGGDIADLEADIDTLVDHNIGLQSAIRDAIKIHRSFNTTTDMADWLQDELNALATPTQPAVTQQPVAFVSAVEFQRMSSRPTVLSRVGIKTTLASEKSETYPIPLYAAPVSPSREVE